MVGAVDAAARDDDHMLHLVREHRAQRRLEVGDLLACADTRAAEAVVGDSASGSNAGASLSYLRLDSIEATDADRANASE